MSTSNSLRRAVHYALLTSAAAAISAPSFAQEQSQNIQEVVVTGSRIAQPNLTTTSPVTMVTAEDIAVQGVTRVEDLINQLPQAFAAQNATVSNGASGAATVDLRGLGSPRTLVLVDGRRMPYGTVTNSAADLNMIPTGMIERVEVLTGGASAAYGSDAVAGVVNFILKKDFEGVQFDGLYGLYQHKNDFGGPGQVKLRDVIAGRAQTNPSAFALPDDNVTDGEAVEFSFMVGASTDDGRGNVTVFGSVRENKAVLQGDRDYSACSLNANPNPSFRCGGSATSYPGYFYIGGDAFTIDQATGNTFRPYNANTDLYNFGPLNYYQRPDTRHNIGVNGHYELAEFADIYTNLMYTDYESIAQIAPGGNFFDTNSVNCDNPFLSQQQLATLGCTPAMVAAGDSVTAYIARRNIEGGGRRQSFSNSSFRGVLGSRGAIAEGWDYDASVQYARTNANPTTLNFFHKTYLARALDAVRDGDGNIVCRSVVDGTDPNCVPWNPFQIGGVTPESLNYIQVPGLQVGVIEQEVYSASVTGDLGVHGLTIPSAQDSIKVVFGVEQRYDRLTNETDDTQAAGLLSGSGGATIGIEGSTKVLDLFTEVSVPLVQGAPGADQLGLDLAYRNSDYDTLTTDTYKVGLEWAPIEDVKFRGSYQRAVRAANIVELFTAQGLNLFDLAGDPCGADLAGTAAAASDAACLATGVPQAQLRAAALDSPAGQYNFLQGGNTALTPEESDTYTYGVVFQPRFLPNLILSIDYFDIEIVDTISTFGSENTLNACYTSGDADACARISRDGAGTLWRTNDGFVQDLNINIGSLSTKGYDLSASYSGVEIGSAGSLSFTLTGTLLDELITEPGPGVAPVECVGKFSGATCGTPKPEWRHHFRTSWMTPWNVDLALTWRYYDAVKNINGLSQFIDYELGAQSYFDLTGTWDVTEKASVMLGINNVLDDNPPLSGAVGTTGNGNTYPQTYDALGRWIFMRARVAF